MQFPRRGSAFGVALALSIGFMMSSPAQTWAQVPGDAYPSDTIQLIVPFSTGGSTDLVARVFAEKLSEAWGQQVIVDNRPGAGGSIGGTALTTAEPDGYTLMVTNPGPSVLSVMLSADAPYSPEDQAPVVYIGHAPLIVVANPEFPADTLAELISYAQENPGQVLWGSSGVNSNPHVALEILKNVTGADITHVPYRGTGPALTDTVAGTIHAMYTTTVSADGLIQSGEVKVLGVAGPTRQEVIPDVPTLAEQGIEDADAMVWIGMVAPAGAPEEIIAKVNQEMNQAMESADVQELFTRLGLEPVGGTPEAFGEFFRAEVERVRQLIEAGAVEAE